MRLHRPDSSKTLFGLLALLMLLPAGSSLAAETSAGVAPHRVGSARWHLARNAERAHADHERTLAEARAHRQRLLAQARAHRQKLLAEARTHRQRLLAEARAERQRLRAVHRQVTRTERRLDSDGETIEFSINGVVQRDRKGAGFELNLRVPDKEAEPRIPHLHDHESGDLEDEETLLIEEEPEVCDNEIDEDDIVFVEEPEQDDIVVVEEPEIVVIEEDEAPNSSAVDGDFASVEGAIIARVNTIRAEHGLSQLRPDSRLQAAAIGHSNEMYRMDYFDHTSPVSEHADFATRINLEGIGDFGVAGENLVMGPDAANLAEHFVQTWMNSPGHRANILGEDFRFTGVGVYGLDGRVYATQLFSQRVDRRAH